MRAALSLYCSVFFFLFSQCHATIHLQPASVLKQQITVWALFVSRTTKCLFLIQALCLPATLSSHAHCLLPSSAPCYIWDAETKKEKGGKKKKVHRSRPEVRCAHSQAGPITAKRLWRGLVRSRKASVTSAIQPDYHFYLRMKWWLCLSPLRWCLSMGNYHFLLCTQWC